MFRKPMRLEKWIAFDGVVGVDVIEVAQDTAADEAEDASLPERHDDARPNGENPDGNSRGDAESDPLAMNAVAFDMAMPFSLDTNTVEFPAGGDDVEIDFPIGFEDRADASFGGNYLPFWDGKVDIDNWEQNHSDHMFFEVTKPENGEFGFMTGTAYPTVAELTAMGFRQGDTVAIAVNYGGPSNVYTVEIVVHNGTYLGSLGVSGRATVENGTVRFALAVQGSTDVSDQADAIQAIFESITYTGDDNPGKFGVNFYYNESAYATTSGAFDDGIGVFDITTPFELEDATQVCVNGKAPEAPDPGGPGGEEPGGPGGEEPGGPGGEEPGGPGGEEPGGPGGEEPGGPGGEEPGGPGGEEPGGPGGEDPGGPGGEEPGLPGGEDPAGPNEPEPPVVPDPEDPVRPPVVDGGNTGGDAGDSGGSSDAGGDAGTDNGGDAGSDSGGDTAGSGDGDSADGVLGGDDIVNTYRRDSEERGVDQSGADNAARGEEPEDVVVTIEDRAVDSASVAVAMELAKYLESYISTVQEDKAALELALSRLQAEYLLRTSGEWGDARFRLRDLFDSGNRELNAINRILEQMRRQIQEFKDYPADRRDGILAETIRDLLDGAERRSGETTALSVALNAVAELLQTRRLDAAPLPADAELAEAFNQAYERAMNEWLAKAAKSDPMGRDLAGTVLTTAAK